MPTLFWKTENRRTCGNWLHRAEKAETECQSELGGESRETQAELLCKISGRVREGTNHLKLGVAKTREELKVSLRGGHPGSLPWLLQPVHPLLKESTRRALLLESLEKRRALGCLHNGGRWSDEVPWKQVERDSPYSHSLLLTLGSRHPGQLIFSTLAGVWRTPLRGSWPTQERNPTDSDPCGSPPVTIGWYPHQWINSTYPELLLFSFLVTVPDIQESPDIWRKPSTGGTWQMRNTGRDGDRGRKPNLHLQRDKRTFCSNKEEQNATQKEFRRRKWCNYPERCGKEENG